MVLGGGGGAEIARPDNAAHYCKGGHRETRFSVRVDAHYKFMISAAGIIGAAHRIKVFSSISFCISYSYVQQTKLTCSLTDTRKAHASQNRACPHGTSAKPARGATRHTSQQLSEVVASAAVADSVAPEVVATGTGACLFSFSSSLLLLLHLSSRGCRDSV